MYQALAADNQNSNSQGPSLRGFFLGENILLALRMVAQDKQVITEIVEKLKIKIPTDLAKESGKLLSVNRVTRILEDTYEAISNYVRQTKPGYVRQALMANAFKWALKNTGYPENFVNVATEGFVMHVAQEVRKTDK